MSDAEGHDSDAFEATYWLLAPVITWICLRHPDWVRRAADPTADGDTFYIEKDPPARKLEQRCAAHWSVPRLSREANAWGVQSYSDAEASLIASLARGDIVASGIPHGRARREVIPPWQWQELVLREEPSGGLEPRRGKLVVYRSTTLPRKDVLEHWTEKHARLRATQRARALKTADRNASLQAAAEAEYEAILTRTQIAPSLRDIAQVLATRREFRSLKAETIERLTRRTW